MQGRSGPVSRAVCSGSSSRTRLPVIASLNGVTSEGWLHYARLLERAGADALELNFYYVDRGIQYESVRLKADTTADGAAHYQDVCPSCRRKNLALMQDALWSRGA